MVGWRARAYLKSQVAPGVFISPVITTGKKKKNSEQLLDHSYTQELFRDFTREQNGQRTQVTHTREK